MAFTIDTSPLFRNNGDYSKELGVLGGAIAERRRREDRLAEVARQDEILRLERERQAKRDRASDIMASAQMDQMQDAASRDRQRLEIDRKKAEADTGQTQFQQRKTLADEADTLTNLLGQGQTSRATARARALGGDLVEQRPETASIGAPEALQLTRPADDLQAPNVTPITQTDRGKTVAPSRAAGLLPAEGLRNMFGQDQPTTDAERTEVQKLDDTRNAMATNREIEAGPRKYTLNLGGQSVELDPRAEITAQNAEEARKFRESVAPTLQERLGNKGGALAEIGAGMLESGATRGQVDSFVSSRVLQLGGGEDTEQARLDRAARRENAIITASGAAAGRASADDARKDVAADRDERLRREMQAREVFDPATGQSLGVAKNEKSSDLADKQLKSLNKLDQLSIQLEDHVNEYGATLDPDKIIKRNAILSNMEIAIKDANDLGAIVGSDQNKIDRITGGLVQNVAGIGVERMKQLRDFNQTQRTSVLRSAGIGSQSAVPGSAAPVGSQQPTQPPRQEDKAADGLIKKLGL